MLSLNEDRPGGKIPDSHSDRAFDYTHKLKLHRLMRDRLLRLRWEIRQLSFALSPAERKQVLANGLDKAGRRRARLDFRCLSRKL